MEIFSKRRKIFACMKKAQSWAGHCYTDRFKATRHLIVAKTRRRQMPHYNKGHHRIPVGRGNEGTPEGGRCFRYPSKFGATSKNLRIFRQVFEECHLDAFTERVLQTPTASAERLPSIRYFQFFLVSPA